MVELQFPYFGDIEDLHDTLDRFRPRLNVAFQDMYGDEMMEVIRNAEESYIDENSFAKPGIRNRIGQEEKVTNSFIFAIGQDENLVISDNGHFTSEPISVAPMFCFSAKALKQKRQYEGWVDHILGAYVHEYNHFAMFALQSPKPMGVLEMIALNGIKPKNWPLEPDDLIEMVKVTKGYERKVLVAKLAAFAMMLHTVQEVSTRKIDEVIFTNLGYTVPDWYLGPNIGRGYVPVPIAEIHGYVVFPIGDILEKYDPQERMLLLRDWVNSSNPAEETQINFMESYRKIKVEVMSVTRMLELFGDTKEGQALQYFIGKRDTAPIPSN